MFIFQPQEASKAARAPSSAMIYWQLVKCDRPTKTAAMWHAPSNNFPVTQTERRKYSKMRESMMEDKEKKKKWHRQFSFLAKTRERTNELQSYVCYFHFQALVLGGVSHLQVPCHFSIG